MTRGMHIGLVLPAVPSYSETFFRNKIIGLQELGIKVSLFAGGPANEFKLCPYYQQPSVKNLLPFAWAKIMQIFILAIFKRPGVLIRLYKLERVQGKSVFESIKTILANTHILAHRLDWLHFGFGTMALGRENLSKAIGAKMAVSLRGFDIAIYPLKYPGCYQNMWSRLDKLHVISNDLAILAFKQGLSPETKVQKITPAIDILHFKCTKQLDAPLSQPLQILTVARLNWKKGLEDTLEALALLKQRNILFNYTIIGEGEEFERLIFAAYQLGIQNQVSFAGKQNPEIVKDAMEKCDIYLQYSISEGFCNAVLEAQAMGCLCLVSDAEGLSENVLHNLTGWIVQKRSPEILFRKLIDVLSMSQASLAEIRKTAIRRVEVEFNILKQNQEFSDFYTSQFK